MPERRKEDRAEAVTEASRWNLVVSIISWPRHTCSTEDSERLDATRWETKVSRDGGAGDASRGGVEEVEETIGEVTAKV